VEGSYHPPLPSICQAALIILFYPLLPRQERHQYKEMSSVEDHQDDLGLDHLSSEERLRELDLFSLEKRWLQGELKAFHHPQGSYQEDGARLFTVVHGRRMTEKGCKLKQERFMLDIKKLLFRQKASQAMEEAGQRGCAASMLRSFPHPTE